MNQPMVTTDNGVTQRVESGVAQRIEADGATTRRREPVSGGGQSPGARPALPTTNNAFAEPEAYTNVIKRAVTNTYFRRRLITDPRTVLSEAGIPVPSGVEVRVREYDEQTLYLLLPPADPSIAEAIEATEALRKSLNQESGEEASLSINPFTGIVLTLEHHEVQTVLEYIRAGRDVAGFIGSLGLGAPSIALQLIGLYLRVMATLIEKLDRGNGVYLTLSWPVILLKQWWLIIPGPR
jgi:hypothetical protein